MKAASRAARISRETTETKVEAALMLDGVGACDVQTGVGFFDHMLAQLARHSLMDIEVRAEGDLHIDAHHTVEDVGIALGRAFSKAVGDGVGLRRYGSCLLPMDEALIRCALDLSKRPFLVWRIETPTEKIGDFDTQLAREFFTAFAMQGGVTLHLEKLSGDNSHHIIEAAFKATARALRDALEIDPRQANAPASTKGVLG